MLSEQEIVRLIKGLRHKDLAEWMELGLVRPERREGRCVYREIDVARLRLIVEIRDEMKEERETIPLVLSLIDQVHGLRHELHRLASAVDAQPETVRAKIVRRLKKT